MTDKEWLILPCMVLVALACIISNIFGIVKGVDKQQQEAVITGHSEWTTCCRVGMTQKVNIK